MGELRAELHRQTTEAATALSHAEARHAGALEGQATEAAAAQSRLEARLGD